MEKSYPQEALGISIDHLTKKPLRRIHMDRALRTNTQRFLDHFRRREKADIQSQIDEIWLAIPTDMFLETKLKRELLYHRGV